ncbi:MAG TPA: carbohydrate-binding protein [Verrucomicrobiae bacterium]|nr:carbohydrate-binding protein [Verrucomicrobiae bacterium]
MPGSYSQPQAGQTVTLTDSTANASIYYTTDGTTPTTSSTQYKNPVTITSTTTIQSIAMAQGYSRSALATGTYTLTPPGSGPAVSIVVTTDDQTMQLTPQPSVSFSTASGSSNVVYLDETQVYQPIEGFGAATTDSAMYLLSEVAQPAQLSQTMNNLFTRQGKGIGLSFLRNPMGASDLARSVYSFDDNNGQADPTLAHFSIAHDLVDIIPLILQAKQLNPQIKIMANPWSPPGWMKDSGSTIGGSLLSSMYTPFANYFVDYIQAYAAAGVTVDYISLQNEPLYVPTNYPGMCMPAILSSADCPTSQTNQATALFSYVAPALTAAGLNTKVLVYDHNWDRPDYPENVLSNQSLSQIAGVAWHGYASTPGAMTPIQNMFSSIGTYETEHSGFVTNSDQTRLDFEEITQCMRNWARAYVKWSLALDENNGPNTGGCSTCTPIVTVNSTSGNIAYGSEYYTMGNFSKYVLPGANRIYSSNAAGIVTAAFVNPAPDNSRILVAFNDSSQPQTFQLQWGTQSFTYTLPSLAGATFTWAGTQSAETPAYTVSAMSQIQASSFNRTAGNNTPGNYLTWGLETELTSDTNGGYDLGFASDGDYTVYNNVDFGAGVSTVAARLACLQDNGQGNGGGNCGGTLEFHLDSNAGTLVASVTVPSTGGWQTWQTTSPANVSGASGVHDLYVVFNAPASGTTSLGNINWFQFK